MKILLGDNQFFGVNHFDLEKGHISNKKEFVKYEKGYPDGSTVDSEGGLWSCRWGGSSVVRFDSNGKLDEVIELPVANVTSCTFGGENLDTLFITTARWSMTAEQINQNPIAGGLFSEFITTECRIIVLSSYNK